MTITIRLERPHARFKESFLEALREFQAARSGLSDTRSMNVQELERDFEGFVAGWLGYEDRANLEPGKVPQTDLWLVDGLEFIGRVKLRHELNDHLRQFGGHIGYEVRPSRWRQGYGRLILRLALERARALGLERVLVTCDADNLGSRGVIEANGGILEGEFKLGWYEKPILRYWIEP